MLYKIYHTQTDGTYFDAKEVRNNGTIFDLAKLNEVLSVITDEEINEDTIWSTMSINGNDIFLPTPDVTRGGWMEAEVTYYYMENDEIIVEFNYRRPNGSDGMTGTTGTAKAYFVANAEGEYVIDRIEIETDDKWSV